MPLKYMKRGRIMIKLKAPSEWQTSGLERRQRSSIKRNGIGVERLSSPKTSKNDRYQHPTREPAQHSVLRV